MPDAYDQAGAKQATAAIGYLRGGKEKPAVQWTDDDQPHPTLSAINVFDRDCGAVHVREKNEVAFRPFGLDVPDELAGACQRLKAAFTTEQTSLEAARDPAGETPRLLRRTRCSKMSRRCVLGPIVYACDKGP